MEELFCSIYRLAGKVDSKLTVDVVVHLGKNNGGMSLASAQTTEICIRYLCGAVGVCRNGKRDQRFVRMESRIVIAECLDFKLLNGLDDLGIDKLYRSFDVTVDLYRIEKSRRSRTEQGRGLSGNDASATMSSIF